MQIGRLNSVVNGPSRPRMRGVSTARQPEPIAAAAASSTPQPLPGKQLKDPLRLEGSHTYSVKLKPPADPSCGLKLYMKQLGQDFSILEMPLGANLIQLSSKAYQIIAPRIQVFDIWLQPSSFARVNFGDDFIGLEATECHLNGSNHVQDLNLNDAFNLLVTMRFRYDDGTKSGKEPQITSTATIAVDLDVPFPFNVTPKAALEATGNTAFEATLKLMLDGYMKNLLADYEEWSKKPELRASRAAAPVS